MGLFGKRKLNPTQQRIYTRVFNAESRKIELRKDKTMMERLKAKARSDAAKAAAPKTHRIIGGLMAIEKGVSSGLKKLPPIDEAKLTAAVCGTPVKKKEHQ